MSINSTNLEARTSDDLDASAPGNSSVQTRLNDLVNSLDVLIHPEKEDGNASLQRELEEVEKELRATHVRVNDLRRQLQLPSLILTPESEPPSYQSATSVTQEQNNAYFNTNLEWIDVLERGSDNWSNLTLKFSRKVDEWDIIDFILFNGKRINKPADGWGTDCGPHVVYGIKKSTPIVIVLDEEWRTAQESDESNELTAKGQREIHYSMIVDRSVWGTKTIPRTFAIQRNQEQ